MRRILSFEEQVLAYLDGDLDQSTSADLIREIQADTEKQRIFDAHTRLRAMLATSHGDIEPADSHQITLALRLPILQELIQVEGSTAIPVTSASHPWRSILSFFDISMMLLALLGFGVAAFRTGPTSGTPSKSFLDYPSQSRTEASVPHEPREAPATHGVHSRSASTVRHSTAGYRFSNSRQNDFTIVTGNSARDDNRNDQLANDAGFVNDVESENDDGLVNEEQLLGLDPATLSRVNPIPDPPAHREDNSHSTLFARWTPSYIDDELVFHPRWSVFGEMSTDSRIFGSINAIHAAPTLADGGGVGVAYQIAPGVETGFEVGRSGFAQLGYDLVADTIPGTIKVSRYESMATIRPIAGFWSRGFASIVIADKEGVDFHLLFNGGIAFLDNPTATFGVGIKGRCEITDVISAVGSVILDASYVRSTGLNPATVNGLPVDRTQEQSGLLTPGICAGFGIQYFAF